jgi:hypothetical protein
MASIYENAFVTIAAAWSENSNGGCFSHTLDKYKVHRLRTSGMYARREPPEFAAAPNDVSVHTAELSPLLTRGWVYQERMLSPRVIYYGKNYIYWECNSTFSSNDGRATLDLKALRGTFSPKNHSWFNNPSGLRRYGFEVRIPIKFRDGFWLDWQRIVEGYTTMNFTYSRDILPALAGIVERQLRYQKDDVYVAGMWKNSLLRDLTFHSDDRPHLNNRNPSWSWARISGPMTFLPMQHELSTLKLLDMSFTRTGPETIGEVTNACIRLEGPTFSVRMNDKGYLEVDRNTPEHYFVTVRVLGYQKYYEVWNIKLGDVLTVLVLSYLREGRIRWSPGILLKQCIGGKFERVAAVIITYSHNDRQENGPYDDDIYNHKNKQYMGKFVSLLLRSTLEII